MWFHFYWLYMVSMCAARLTDQLYGGLPNSCKDSCANWINGTTSCIENLDGNAHIDFTGVSPSFQYHGSKLRLYSCVCTTDRIDSSTPCWQCLNELKCISPPVTVGDYKSICLNPSGFDVVKFSFKCPSG